MIIGFIGQGFVGKNYADDFERRGYSVVRYSQEEPHIVNKDRIAECDIVFIAVPTPTTIDGFDDSILRAVLPLVGKGKIAVIKSTVIPGTTKKLQEEFPEIVLLMSPEFLSETTSAYDSANPPQNIVGILIGNSSHEKAAALIHSVLPPAQYQLTCTNTEAELFKYAHNVNGYFQIILSNLLYELAQKFGADWNVIQNAIEADPLISSRYSNPIHKSGRGAGGNCFIKDFAAFSELYANVVGENEGNKVLNALKNKNIKLLVESGKSIDILRGVYGNAIDK